MPLDGVEALIQAIDEFSGFPAWADAAFD
jgi:hypothetical protein